MEISPRDRGGAFGERFSNSISARLRGLWVLALLGYDGSLPYTAGGIVAAK
jgi:hypothetical protein